MTVNGKMRSGFQIFLEKSTANGETASRVVAMSATLSLKNSLANLKVKTTPTTLRTAMKAEATMGLADIRKGMARM